MDAIEKQQNPHVSLLTSKGRSLYRCSHQELHDPFPRQKFSGDHASALILYLRACGIIPEEITQYVITISGRNRDFDRYATMDKFASYGGIS